MTRRLLLALVAVLYLAAGTGSARAAVPADFVGIASDDVFAGSDAYRQSTLTAQAGLGIGLIRQTFQWSAIERSPGNYRFGAYDQYVGDTARHGISILPILYQPPGFRSSRPRRHARRGVYPPKRASDMGSFGSALARRYGPNGSFWTEHPDVPRRPITAWQVWNEPNLRYYWPRGPSAAQYTRLLRATGKAIKAVDPSAEIVTAGLADSHLGGSVPLKRFISGMYRAGARGSFDTLALNAYAVNVKQLGSSLRAVRRSMRARRDGSPIWITELGWCDRGPRSRFCVGARRQGRLIEQAFRYVGSRRTSLGLRGLVYFTWKDGKPYPPLYQDFWALHSGLHRRSGAAKPALAAFRRSVARLRR
jgi:hypothetical protein